jgi:hypothetical protein
MPVQLTCWIYSKSAPNWQSSAKTHNASEIAHGFAESDRFEQERILQHQLIHDVKLLAAVYEWLKRNRELVAASRLRQLYLTVSRNGIASS